MLRDSIESNSAFFKTASKKRLFFYLSFLVTFFFAINSAAEERFSLNSTINEALQSNPEILSAKRSYEAASARIWQAASLNDPVVDFEYNKMFANRALTGEPMKMLGMSQDIPFPTKLYLRAKIASKLAKMAYENYKAKELEIISDVKTNYSELAFIYKSIEVQKENKSLLEQLSASATRRYSTGEGTQADVLRAQVELAKVDNELIMLEQRRVTTQAKLNVLLNRDPKDEIGIPASEEPIRFTRKLEEFYIDAKDKNPELKAYRYGIEKGKAAYDLSLNEFMPDFKVKYTAMAGRDKLETKNWAGMLGATIPLWFFQKQAFGVKEMKSELEMLKAEYKTKENMILFDIRDAYARVEANIKVVELYETAFIPQANESLKASIKSYESLKSDFFTILDSERMLIDFKLDHFRAAVNLRIALADLERAIGGNIDIVHEEEVKNEKK